MLKNIGKRIRALRREKGVTLVELANQTKVAQATLSRIETGTMIGTIESHEKIAEALGIGLAELYAGIDKRHEAISHLSQTAARKSTHHTKNVQIELLTQESHQKKILPLLITLKAKAHTEPEPSQRGVEKFLYLLEGELKVALEEREFALKENETLYFDASLAHRITNSGTLPAKFLTIVAPQKS